MKASLMAGVAGVVFALGVGLGGMTDPARVLGFLDVAGAWDPSLAIVMGGAFGVHAVARRLILRRPAPVLAASFPSISQVRVDGKLVAGSALFGVGWGLSGYCPGPALTSVVSGAWEVLLFVASMAAGMALFSVWERVRAWSRGAGTVASGSPSNLVP